MTFEPDRTHQSGPRRRGGTRPLRVPPAAGGNAGTAGGSAAGTLAEEIEESAFEFVHAAVPFDLPVAGSTVRQRDTSVGGSNQPLVRRGYGIYRRVGGRFATGDTAITVDQLPQGASPCPHR